MEADAQHERDEREEWERLHDELVSMTSDWTAAELQALIRMIREVKALARLTQSGATNSDRNGQ
jgi:hypothetical protein